MTVRTDRSFVTDDNFEGQWDALWQGWYTNSDEGRFVIRIQRLGHGPHVTVELSRGDIEALRDKFGPGFDVDEGASVILGGVLTIDGRMSQDMVATRESAFQPVLLQAIGEDVRLRVKDVEWAACRERLGIGRAFEGESEEGE